MDEPRSNSEPPADLPDDDSPLTEELVAYLDGELGADGAEAVEARIGLDPTVRAEADALKKTWDLLDYLPRPEPSPNFTERTLSRLEPVRQIGSISTPSGPALSKNGSAAQSSQASTASLPLAPSRTPRQKLVVVFTWLVILATVAFGGYFVRAQIVRMDQHELDARILSEQRMLQNVQRFRHVDDLAFLQALDNPELFGDEPYATSSEGPK
jgi:anti-sigma factor RsiW